MGSQVGNPCVVRPTVLNGLACVCVLDVTKTERIQVFYVARRSIKQYVQVKRSTDTGSIYENGNITPEVVVADLGRQFIKTRLPLHP